MFNKKSANISKKTSLSVAIAIALSLTGCGGDSDPSTNNDGDSGSQGGAYSGSQKKGTLCVDENINGTCDASEVSAADVNIGVIPGNLQSNDFPRVLAFADGGQLTAAPGASEISPLSTLLYSEISYNATTGGDIAQAQSYLNDKLGIEGKLTAEQNDQFNGSISTALSDNPSANHYAVIAAVVDAIVVSKNFQASVSTADIEKQFMAIQKLDMTLGVAADWQATIDELDSDWVDASDSFVASLDANAGLIVAGSAYHNSLTILDPAAADLSPKHKFLPCFQAQDMAR